MRPIPGILAAAVGYCVSLLSAVAYLAANGWFGAGDLYAFAFWSLPFALLLAITASRLRRWLAGQRRLRRHLAASAAGVLLALCWTLALAVVMGPWMGAFSIPILYAWALGGISAFVAVRAGPAPTAPASGRPKRHWVWRALPWVIGVPVGSLVLVVALWFGSLYGSIYLWNRAEPELHRIPAGYVGPVVIVFDQPDGVPGRYEGRRRIYDIPADGVLRTRLAPTTGWSAPDYVYVSTDGRTTPIVRGAPCEDSLPPRTVQACLMGRMQVNGRSGSEYQAYTVGPTSDRRRLYEQGDSMVRAVIFGD